MSLHTTHIEWQRRLGFVYARDWLMVASKRDFTVKDIKTKVANYYGVSLADIDSKKRNGPIVFARQTAMYLAKTLTPFSHSRIARIFGVEHTTVLHALRKITRLRASDTAIHIDLTNLEKCFRPEICAKSMDNSSSQNGLS